MRRFMIEVHGTLQIRVPIDAKDLDSAHAAAATWADNHLRDDGHLLDVKTALVTRANVLVTPEELARGIGELDPRYRDLKDSSKIE